jgi:hypothetical protein
VIDAAYNPISINEDFFLATNAEGKGTRIENLAAGENLGQIDDLKYFNNKMIRGLGVPSSYLPTGPDDGTAAYTDGKTGTAFVQEYRFTKYCERLQNLMSPVLDKEFKLFLKHRGIEIQSNLFELQFFAPESFGEYRRMSMDADQINLFSTLMGTEATKYVSKRFALERYLGWTQDDISRNEQMWREENADKVKTKTGIGAGSEPPGMNAIGMRPESETAAPEGEEPAGEEVAPPLEGGETPAGGGAPAPAPPGGGILGGA